MSLHAHTVIIVIPPRTVCVFPFIPHEIILKIFRVIYYSFPHSRSIPCTKDMSWVYCLRWRWQSAVVCVVVGSSNTPEQPHLTAISSFLSLSFPFQLDWMRSLVCVCIHLTCKTLQICLYSNHTEQKRAAGGGRMKNFHLKHKLINLESCFWEIAVPARISCRRRCRCLRAAHINGRCHTAEFERERVRPKCDATLIMSTFHIRHASGEGNEERRAMVEGNGTPTIHCCCCSLLSDEISFSLSLCVSWSAIAPHKKHKKWNVKNEKIYI
jgi:hypothetical protein